MSLRTFRNASPPYTAVSYRDFRLDHLEAGTLRVPFRVNKADQPIFLVRLKEMITDREADHYHECDQQQILPSQTRHKHATDEYREIRQGRAQIGLLDH